MNKVQEVGVIAIMIPTRQTRNSEGKIGYSCLPVRQCNIYQEKGRRTHEFTRGFTRLRIIISEWRGSVPRRNNFSFEGHSRFHEEMIFLSRGKTRGNSWYPPNFFLVNIIVSQGEGRHVASTVSRPRLKFLFP